MEFLAIIMTDILFLALVFFVISLDRRITRMETRSRQDIGRLTERLFNVNRSVQALQRLMEFQGASSCAERDERSELLERQFTQAVEEIMAFGAPRAADSEAVK